MTRQPPALATWVLERFCGDPGLAGDLIEEYARRQSARWYWKQAVMAVGAYSASQIMEHKWLAVRAIATGYAIWYVFNATLLRGFIRPWLAPDTTLEKAALLTLGYAIWLANGWTIAKLHRPYSTAMVFAYVLWAIVASVPPVYTAAVNTITGSTDGSKLAWELITRLGVIVTLITGGTLAAYRDQLKQARAGAQAWRGESPGALAG